MINICPTCNGEGIKLGRLGNLIHYKCRCCGMFFSENAQIVIDVNVQDIEKDYAERENENET